MKSAYYLNLKETYMKNADFGYNMGFLDNIFGRDYSKSTDYAVGIDYINKFHNANKTSAKAYVDNLYVKFPRTKVIADIESLGLAIKFTNMSESAVKTTAETLASLTSGKVPASVGDFRFALQNQATATPVADFVVDNVIVQKLAQVGDTIISAGEAVASVAEAGLETASFASKVVKAMPYVAVAGVLFLGYKYITGGGAKGIASKLLK